MKLTIDQLNNVSYRNEKIPIEETKMSCVEYGKKLKKRNTHKSKCLNTTTQYTHIHAHTCFVAHSEAVFLNSSVCLHIFFTLFIL